MKWWSQMKTTLSKSISQTNEKLLTWKAWAKNDEVRPTPWSSRPRRTGSGKNAIILSFKVKECKINQLHRGGCTPANCAVSNTQTRSTFSLLSLENHCAALKQGAMVCPPEGSSAVTNFSTSESKNQHLLFFFVFFGWAERSSLAITSCLVNILSSMTVSCQELWSREELTSTRLLNKNPGFITTEAEPFQRSKCALLAWSQAETLLSFNQLHRYFSLIDY